MHALTHSHSQQDHAHTQHTPQASPKKRSTKHCLGSANMANPPMLRFCAARAAAPAAAAAATAAAVAAEVPLP